MATVEVRIPRPGTQSSEWRGSTGTFAVSGKRVALVNNGWGSADDLVGVFEDILRAQYGAADVRHFRAFGNREDNLNYDEDEAAFVDEIVEFGDVAISMLGNCGGCTAWTCNTSAELERRGLRSAALVTGLFKPLAEFTLAKTNKMPHHPLIVLSDHFEFTDREALEEAAATTLRTLYDPGEAPAAVGAAGEAQG
jgi:hypothetical protein